MSAPENKSPPGATVHSERRSADADLKESEERYRRLFGRQLCEIGFFKDILAGGLAHDFNNVLSAINGFPEMALSAAEAEGTLHDYLSQIRKAGGRAAALSRR